MNQVFERMILKRAELQGGYHRGRPRLLNDQEAIRSIFKVARTGMQWREVSTSFSHTTLFRRMHHWIRTNVFFDAYKDALKVYKKLHATKYYCIDSQYVKNRFGRKEYVGKNHTDRGRKATKVSVVADQNGIVHAFKMDPGNVPDVVLFTSTLRSAIDHLERNVPIYADRGYDSRRNKSDCVGIFGLQDRIFRRKTKTTRRTNARRIVVEHCFAWRSAFRRLLFLYETETQTHKAFSIIALGHLLASRFLHE